MSSVILSVVAGERVPDPLRTTASTNPANTADLVGEIGKVLRDTGMPPERLWLGMPVNALLADKGEAMDNMRLLAENGVKAVALDFADRGIRANAIIPGLIETPQSLDPVNSLGPDGLARAGQTIPWGRVGRPEEVAGVIAFLTSADAGYVSGQAITVDGALTVAMRD